MGTPLEGVITLEPDVYSKGVIFGDTEQPIQGIYEESSTQQLALGTKLVYGDGRVFRYAKNGGTALSKALMTASEALVTNVFDELQGTSGTSQEVGDQQILIDVTTGGTWVENEYANGFLVVNKSTGIGDFYKVVANKIRSSDVLMDVLLEKSLITALAAGTEITMVKSPWRDVDVQPTTAEGTPAGIPLIDVTANYYCWLQRGGYAPCIVDTSEQLVKGEPAGMPATSNVAGACGPVGADTDAQWGIAVYIADAAEVAILDLTLDS
jgi:hypothetical protein